MNKITFPLDLRMKGPEVADLQEALKLALDKAAILANDEAARRALAATLLRENIQQLYGETTARLVSVFQRERHLQPSGEVDSPTAEALNKLLREFGQLDEERQPAIRLVAGVLRREDGLSLQGVQIRAMHLSDGGSIRLGDDNTYGDGRYTIRYEALPGIDGINLSVSAIGNNGKTLVASEVIRRASSLETIDLTVPIVAAVTERGTIEGAIALEHGLPAEKLKLRLYRRDFGGSRTLLGETTTLSEGRYAFSYDSDGSAASLEVRAVDDNGTEVALSKPFDQSTTDTRARLNLLAPGRLQPLAAEYDRLSADLTPHVVQMSKLAHAKEDAELQDITVLNRATGWDARLIALASITESLAADADVGLPSEALYGLVRSGLPSDKLLLAQVDPDVMEMAINKARQAGIVEFDDAGVAKLKAKFTEFANKTRLGIKVSGSGSTYGDMLRSSGLPQAAQQKFAPVYLKHRGDGAELWEEARKAGLNGTQIGKLQLHGKLAFLAGNSEAMTTRLLNKGLKNPVELAGQDFHSADAWKTEMFEQAGIPGRRRANPTEADNKKLEPLIPAAYAGEKVEKRLEAYAEDMARKVRLSYPTQVLARMVETDQRFKLSSGHDATVKLLKNATAQGFRLGETPVSRFLQSRTGVRDGLSDAEFDAAGEQLKVLQRVYQITPSNEAMPVLVALGMTSAFDVMAYPEEQFIALFKAKYLEIFKTPAPAGVPELVSRKAKQVSSVTYNLFAIAKKLESEPPVVGISAPQEVRESVKNELIKHYPTMESLFGSMDYCECEHCRSVLSPAAYLVDLLQFVDAEPAVWGNFLAHWKATHGDQTYPHENAAGDAMKPYDVLIERRPDLPHIALTCENTHTALPYIDIVNEILEYYVANGKLAKEAVRDTGDATTAELLSEPQNVIREAYDALRATRYPLNLPFDLWLETVRKFCDYFEAPLHRVLEVFRPDEDVFAPIQNPTNVGNATVSVANPDATKLTNGMPCTYHVAGSNTSSAESLRISAIGAPDSGGAGQATITFAGTWTSAPAAGDRLVSRPLDKRAAIFMESIGLASAEIEIFSDTDPLTKWHELYGFATEAEAITEANDAVTGQRTDLNSAKALSRRLAVTYKEITDIVQTGFVNPELDKLSLIYKLDVRVRDAELYKQERTFYEANKDLLGKDRSTLSPADQQRFDDLATKRPNSETTGWQVLNEVAAIEQRLADLAAAFKPPLNLTDLRNEIEAIRFDRILMLADPDAGCNFDQTTLRYADGTKADAIAFLRINLFVRLWRKLGWSVEETDRALTTFVPSSTPFDGANANLAKRPLSTALIYLAHLKALDETLKVGKQSRLKLLTLWSNIGTSGAKPLYAQLFLTRSVLKSSPVFDHPLGHYLTDPTIKLKTHLLTLQGALGLTADEAGRILSDAGKSLDTAELSLANVSLLYRYSLLAKAVKLPVRDLIALKQLSGLNPFRDLHPDPLATLDHDYPFTQTLEFVKVAEEVKDSGLKVEDLEYLFRHRFDETGKYRLDRDATLASIKSLAEGVRAIRAAHAVPEDPGSVNADELRQKLGLALRPDVVERFLGMVDTTIEFTATTSGVNTVDQFDPAKFAAEERIRQVSYQEVPHKEQKLTVRGVLFDSAKSAMKARFDAALSTPQKQAFAKLLDGAEELARDFFANQLRKQTLRLDGEAGFLDDADFARLFAPLETPIEIPATDTQAEVDFKRIENEKIEIRNLEELQQRRYRIAQAFLPFLQQRLIRQFIVQTITAQTGADPVLVDSLVADDRLLAAPGALLDVLAATGTHGLNAKFWMSADASGAALPAVSLADADTGANDGAGNPLKPAGAGSAQLEAYIEVPSTGAYRFYLELDKQNAEAELRFSHRAEPVLVQGTAGTDHATLGDLPDEYLELKAGILYRMSLDLKHLNGGDARLLVQGETVPKGPLSQLTLYPAASIEAAEHATTLLSKALQLAQSLGVSEREIRYLMTHANDFGGVSLSDLPTAAVGDTAAEKNSAAQRFDRFRRLAAYARLKRELAGGTDDLIGIFAANGTDAADKLAKQVYPLIARLTRRDEATVRSSAEALVAAPGGVPAFESERPLWRLWEALQIVERFGVSPALLLGWPDIVSSATPGVRRFELARDVKETVKARFEPETWQRVAQPIFDKLRARQRDALVSYVMHQHGFDRMEQLYEYFLVDPGMEPVVQTSRIRLATASLQLFIQRSLLNLEAKVHPSTIDARQWEWMKRYRVWEANRKIFLFPENWLEPEFRDDKTHLFTELEGALLQGDVSSDLVEDAFLSYLKKLDELARLDICAMHIEDSADPSGRILHVFGRSYSQPRKYFYRRYVHQIWTPWEPVSAEIEGDHLVPVVWRDRVYLFWVTFLEKAQRSTSDTTITDAAESVTIAAAKIDVEAQLHWSEYLDGEWTTRESGDFSAPSPVVARGLLRFDAKDVFVHVAKEYEDGEERGVFVHLYQTYRSVTPTGGAISMHEMSGHLGAEKAVKISGAVAFPFGTAPVVSPFKGAFYLAGRNSAPESGAYKSKPDNPFPSANAPIANRYRGNGALRVRFKERVTTESDETIPTFANPNILNKGARYSLLPSDNDLTALGVSEDAYRGAAHPDVIKAAIENSVGDIATLMRPVFYQDNRHTFYVEPEVTERTIEEWQEWVTRPPAPEPGWKLPDWWKDIVIKPEIPHKGPIPVPEDPWGSPISPGSLINPGRDYDWLVNPGSAIKFGDVLIGPVGQPGMQIRGAEDALSNLGHVNASPGSDLAGGSTLVLSNPDSFGRSGLWDIAGGLNVVGGSGFNAALENNLTELNRSGFGASAPGFSRTES